MTTPVMFVDVETTGLDPDVHEVWEIALISDSGTEHLYHVRPAHLAAADPGALRLIRYYERGELEGWTWDNDRHVADEVALITAGRHLVGAVPSFDAAFLSRFLRLHARREAWHYHLIDVEALAAGKLGMKPPWDSADLAQRVGVNGDLPEFAKHTALGDARWAKAIYEAVLGREEG